MKVKGYYALNTCLVKKCNLAAPFTVYYHMNKLHSLQYRQERVAAMIDELNVLASSTTSEQHTIKFDLVAALEELRNELIDLRKEVNVLVEANNVIA